MAATYTLTALAVTRSASKNMLGINNATGSGKVIRVFRIWMTNPHTAAVSGGMGYYTLGRISSAQYTSGTAINFLPHASVLTAGAATPFTGIGAAHGVTQASSFSHEFKRILASSDEIALSGTTVDEVAYGMLFPWSVVWDSGYGESDVEPIVIRENQVLLLRAGSVGTYVGSADIHVELTIT